MNKKDFTPKQEQIAHMRYTMICGIIPVVDDKKKLAAAVKRTATEYGVSKPTIRNYLKLYLENKDIMALAPKIRNSGRKELTDFEKDFRWALNKYYYTADKRTLTDTYTLLIKERYYSNGELLPDYPSFGQFRYYFEKTRSITNEIIRRQGLSAYQRNERPLLGESVRDYTPIVGYGLLDSTICDIYLVNDANQLVGRPILTVCIDGYTGLCCGFSLGWEGGNYALSKLMQNIITDKVAYCSDFGIKINERDWPCHQLAGKYITDKGSEYASERFGQLCDLGITIENLQAYRAELKGPVEKFFDLVQSSFKPFLKGCGLIEPDFMERGSVDYRRQAKLTLRQFETIIIRCIIYHNTGRILENFPYTKEMLEENVKPYASCIWNYCVENEATNLISVDKNVLVQTLLPRATAKFTRRGLIINNLRYKAEGFNDEYLGGRVGTVAYVPDNVDTVYLIENGEYIPFSLIDARFSASTVKSVEEHKKQEKELIKTYKEEQILSKVQLAEQIETITRQSTVDENLTAACVKNIRKTRQKERERCHR